MGLYADYVLPHLIDCACGSPDIARLRRDLVPQAYGRVLEVGIGSGLNLSHYDPERVEVVWGLEPSRGMRRKAERRIAATALDLRWLADRGEAIPLADDAVDTVLLTFTLCTIQDWRRALDEMRRVLKPGGQLLFCEHGLAPDAPVRRWQERLNPVWKRIAGGCHLNRPIDRYVEQAGFRIHDLATGYLAHTPRFAGFNYRGIARAG
jgi:ubiquinone/menaquinone biosynthesis C-methylase UbiE